MIDDLNLVKTTKFNNPNYIGDPINAVRVFNDLKADEIIFLDISSSKNGRAIPIEFVKKVGEEAFMPFAFGGGIKTIEEIKQILKNGAEKVVINTYSVKNPQLIKEASNIFGSQSIVVLIDVKKIEDSYKVFINGGSEETDLDPVDHAKNMESCGAGEIIINSIDNDGMMEGYDLKLIKKVVRSVSIPVVAIGGASVYKDLEKAVMIGGACDVAAGSGFVNYDKNKVVLINYPVREDREKRIY